MSYLGKYARITIAREVVWEILRCDDEWTAAPFTMKEFFERHAVELQKALAPLNPNSSAEAMVRGALQSLNKKGLIMATRSWGETTYSKNIYIIYKALVPYNYGRAMLEAQRLRLL
jgi:hypothetical protein